jgi:hypothetical protein
MDLEQLLVNAQAEFSQLTSQFEQLNGQLRELEAQALRKQGELELLQRLINSKE